MNDKVGSKNKSGYKGHEGVKGKGQEVVPTFYYIIVKGKVPMLYPHCKLCSHSIHLLHLTLLLTVTMQLLMWGHIHTMKSSLSEMSSQPSNS